MDSCYKCSVKEVCKLFDFASKSMHLASINISSCKVKPDTRDYSHHRLECGNTPTKPENRIDRASEVSVWPPLRKYKDFKTESNSLRNNGVGEEKVLKIDLEEANIKILEKNPVTESIMVQCPTCKGTTVDDDLDLCQSKNCETIVCSNCGTTENKNRFCKECWEKK